MPEPLIAGVPAIRDGMITQEVEQVFPDRVQTSGVGYQMLTFRGFEALTVEPLRGLRLEKDEEIRSLQAQNRELEGRVQRLEALVEQMASAVSERETK